MRYGSVCSGIEAATAAWHPLGWKPAFFSEIEKFSRTVLEHHYPEVPLHGDFTTIGADEYGPIELLVGGTPCQSFSIAGLRKGLDDERGNLALEFLKLAQRKRPQWVVWENVPGVFSSESHTAPDPCPPPPPVDMGLNGQELETEDDYEAEELHAFWCFLSGLSELGYGYAYRVLDAQYCGVPQRRRRPFVIGYLGDWRPAAAVLFERESLQRNPPPSRKTREDVARCLRGRANSSHREDSDNFISTHRMRGFGDYALDECASALKSRDAKDATDLIAFSAKDHGADAMNECSPTLRAGTADKSHANGGTPPAIAFKPSHYTRGKDGAPSEVVPPLSAEADKGDQEAVVFAENSRGELRLEGGDGKRTGALLTGGGKPGQGSPVIAQSMAVRRLTPMECERLQGFPDNFTQIPYRGKSIDRCPDGPRYKALGNSMAVPVMGWIGQRIQMVSDLLEDTAA